MPYWHDTAQDGVNGGYLLADRRSGREEARQKQLVGQSRMIWGFAHAHLQGISDGQRSYLDAAEQGYRFLLRHFLDPRHGGYYWTTGLAGHVLNPRKFTYAQAFVIFSLVEFYRASADASALEHAFELYRHLLNHAHDAKHGGWVEHFQRDWTPILGPEEGVFIERPGLKSANTHLHLMEAYAELYEVTKDPALKSHLEELLNINRRYFYPQDAGRSCFHRGRDWSWVSDPQSAGLSYGHNVEFAWLMIRAQQVLGMPPSWDHFYGHLDHALQYGYDHRRGGLYDRGTGDLPATSKEKIWWVEAEMLAALAEALGHRDSPQYRLALWKLVKFIERHLMDPCDGVWLSRVSETGKVVNDAKAYDWKANYHDVRALVKFCRTFVPQRD